VKAKITYHQSTPPNLMLLNKPKVMHIIGIIEYVTLGAARSGE